MMFELIQLYTMFANAKKLSNSSMFFCEKRILNSHNCFFLYIKFHLIFLLQSKGESKNQESIQSSNTPDPGQHMRK